MDEDTGTVTFVYFNMTSDLVSTTNANPIIIPEISEIIPKKSISKASSSSSSSASSAFRPSSSSSRVDNDTIETYGFEMNMVLVNVVLISFIVYLLLLLFDACGFWKTVSKILKKLCCCFNRKPKIKSVAFVEDN